MRQAVHVSLAAFLVIAGACNIDNEGEPPPKATLYFPNGLALLGGDPDTPPSHLLVANSNFDLRYNAGTLQAYRIEDLLAGIATCEEAAEQAREDGERPEECVLLPEEPGKDKWDVDEVLVGSFTNGLALSPDGDRAFVASRTKPSLEVIDVDLSARDDIFGCDDRRAGCAALAARGVDPETGDPRDRWPGDPSALLARPMSDWVPGGEGLGDYVLVAHAVGAVSLFTEQLDDAGAPNGEFELRSVLRGLPSQPNSIEYDAATGMVYLSWAPPPARFLRAGKAVERIGVSVPVLDGEPDIDNASLYRLDRLVLDGVATLSDTRDLAFIEHGTPERENRALVLTRDPDALLLTDVDETRNPEGVGLVLRIAALGSGPSRVEVGVLEGELGALDVAVVSCFSGREIYVIDLATMNVRTVIPNLSGPFDLALDEARQLLYVADFRSSVIRIVDLSPLTDPTSLEGARVVATLGEAQVIQELQ